MRSSASRRTSGRTSARPAVANDLTLLEMAEALDRMDRDLNSWEAGFLNTVLDPLRFELDLTGPQKEKLKQIYERYLGEDAAIDETVDDVDF